MIDIVLNENTYKASRLKVRKFKGEKYRTAAPLSTLTQV